MATKKEVLEQALRGEGCLGRAADDEPVFVLRAQDVFAAGLVNAWAGEAGGVGCPPEKVEEAHKLATQMRKWPTHKYPD